MNPKIGVDNIERINKWVGLEKQGEFRSVPNQQFVLHLKNDVLAPFVHLVDAIEREILERMSVGEVNEMILLCAVSGDVAEEINRGDVHTISFIVPKHRNNMSTAANIEWDPFIAAIDLNSVNQVSEIHNSPAVFSGLEDLGRSDISGLIGEGSYIGIPLWPMLRFGYCLGKCVLNGEKKCHKKTILLNEMPFATWYSKILDT